MSAFARSTPYRSIVRAALAAAGSILLALTSCAGGPCLPGTTCVDSAQYSETFVNPEASLVDAATDGTDAAGE